MLCRKAMTYAPRRGAENRSAVKGTREVFFPRQEGGPGKVPRPLRVLVADDERDTVLSLMMLLREEGHDVQGVHSGRQAISRVIDFDPDVVIVDINMPERSGWEVARTIRARGEDRPMLIGISGQYKAGSDKVLSQIVGFDHYLLKPYAPAELLALIAPLQPTLDRAPASLERTVSRLIAMAGSLLRAPSKVREYMKCSETDFVDYRAGRKAPSQAEVERLVDLIVREQSNIIARNRDLLLEIRAKLEKLEGL